MKENRYTDWARYWGEPTGWTHNHREDGWSTAEVPQPKSDIQRSSWAKALGWRKIFICERVTYPKDGTP